MSEIIFTPNAPASNPLLSQAHVVGKLVFTSGQTSVNPTDNTMPEGIEAQAEQCIRNLNAVLLASGSDLQHVVKTTCYLRNPEDAAAFNKVYGKYFTGKPARSCFAVNFPNKKLLCEIEAIAEKIE